MASYLLRQFVGPSNSETKGPTWVMKAQGTIYRGGLLALTATTLVWTSIFLYAFFYHTYMPPISHTKSVYLQFRYDMNPNSDHDSAILQESLITIF
jgi:hypothetical protein